MTAPAGPVLGRRPQEDTLFGRAVAAATDAVFCQDTLGVVLSWNLAAERLYGFPAVEMIGHVLRPLAALESRGELESAYDRAVAGEPVPRFDSWHCHRDGTRMPVAVSVVPLREPNGRVDAVATTVAASLVDCSRFLPAPRESVPVDLGWVLARVRSSLSAAISEAGADIQVGPMPLVRSHEKQIESLVQSLLSNAITSRNPDRVPQVVVTATSADGWVTLRVDDNGIGIAPEYRDRIFRMFQRLPVREAQPGTGIGLSIAQQIVELTGGRIWADESPLGGARVACTLRSAEGQSAGAETL